MPVDLTETHRQAQLAVRAAFLRDLLILWPALDVRRLDETFPGWAHAVALLIGKHRATSAGLAVAYVQALRASLIGLGGFTPVLADPAAPDQITRNLIVTSVIPVKKAMGREVALSAARDAAFVLTAGATSKLVLDGGRQTILDTVHRDRKALGWRRVTDSRPCSFCALLATRGAVYRGDTAHFAAHGHCGCTAEPVYDQADREARDEALPWAQLYTDSTQDAHGEDKTAAFRAAYTARYGR